MTDINTRMNRRAVLKALGATMALPLFESFAPISRLSAAPSGIGSLPAGPPRRFATMLFANGVNVDHWWAKGDGDAMELSSTLKPLDPFKNDILVLNKLEYFGGTSGAHWPQFTNFLSGTTLRQSPLPDAARSIDQVIADVVGRETFLPSMHLGVEPARPGLRLGVPAIYYSTVSWNSKNTPIPPEVFPSAAFDRLFNKEGLLRNKSVLDLTLDQSKRLRRDLSGQDRHKLDQFMDNVRNLEQRIERATADDRLEGWIPTITEPNLERPPEGKPQDFPDHTKMMLDVLVLALQMDKTRVATFIMESDATGLPFDFIDGVGKAGMHGISHHSGKEDVLEQYRRINEWHVKQLAYVMGRMKDIDEGNGSLLDNTMLLFGSNMMDGNRHDGRELPLVLAGGRNCEITPGRVLTYAGDECEFNNLHLAMAQRMGVPMESFGDSKMVLPRLV